MFYFVLLEVFTKRSRKKDWNDRNWATCEANNTNPNNAHSYNFTELKISSRSVVQVFYRWLVCKYIIFILETFRLYKLQKGWYKIWFFIQFSRFLALSWRKNILPDVYDKQKRYISSDTKLYFLTKPQSKNLLKTS